MEKYKHIEELGNLLGQYENKLENLEEILFFLEDTFEDYSKLFDYYYSLQREQDIKEDEKGMIPTYINRSVLSEDSIYNLFYTYRKLSLQMLNVSKNFFEKM